MNGKHGACQGSSEERCHRVADWIEARQRCPTPVPRLSEAVERAGAPDWIAGDLGIGMMVALGVYRY